MRKDMTRVLFGVVLVLAAVMIFGNSIGWWSIQNFDGWWTVFLIVPGLAGLISYGFNLASTCLVLVGAWLLARAQGWLPYPFADHIVWVVILLLIGLQLIFGSFRRHGVPASPVFMDGVHGAFDSNSSVNYSAVFGGVEVSNNSTAFCGGSVSAVFGGAKLDLRNAVPINGAVLEANAVFGGVDIFAPVNCRLQIVGTPFLGGCECKAQRPADPSLPLLTIRYTSVFGGVTVK